MSFRYRFIVNPASRGGALRKEWPSIEETLRRELGTFEKEFTTEKGSAIRLTQDALLDGVDVVVAVGGDGTINEVVNGFFKEQKPLAVKQSLGFLPFGTGGDFKRTLGLDSDIQRSARVLKGAKTRTCDVGKIGYTDFDGGESSRYFLNIASFGLSGLVDQIANDSSKRWGGKASFFMASAKASLQYSNQRVQLIFDKDVSSTAEMTIQTVAVCNGQFFGGGMHVAPKAQIDDGRFDVTAIGDLSKLEVLKLGTKIYKGNHLSMTKVTSKQCSELEALPLTGKDVLIDVDGEALGKLPATFSIKKDAIDIITP